MECQLPASVQGIFTPWTIEAHIPYMHVIYVILYLCYIIGFGLITVRPCLLSANNPYKTFRTGFQRLQSSPVLRFGVHVDPAFPHHFLPPPSATVSRVICYWCVRRPNRRKGVVEEGGVEGAGGRSFPDVFNQPVICRRSRWSDLANSGVFGIPNEAIDRSVYDDMFCFLYVNNVYYVS